MVMRGVPGLPNQPEVPMKHHSHHHHQKSDQSVASASHEPITPESANAFPVVAAGTALDGRSQSRYSARQIDESRFIVTFDWVHGNQESTTVCSVDQQIHPTLAIAKQAVQRATRDFNQTENEERLDALEAQRADQAQELY